MNATSSTFESTTEFALDALTCVSDIDLWYRKIFGAPPSRSGLVHVVATWHDPAGHLDVLATGDSAPRCAEDAFALAMARARADAILTTGSVLRQEPTLCHTPTAALPGGDDTRLADALTEWRTENGPRRPAATVIMSRSRDLDLDHPIFDGDQVFVYTGDDAPTRFGIELAQRGAMLITDPDPSPRACLARLDRAGYDAITVEAGPQVTSAFYDAPIAIDELLVTTLETPALDPALRRGRLIDDDGLTERFGTPSEIYRTENADGPWSLRRFAR